MPRIGWTQEPVDTANTNRDGSGTLVEIVTLDSDTYVDRIVCHTLGTNIATTGVIIASNGSGLANPRNNWLMGRESLPMTTTGTVNSGDCVAFTIDAWMEEGTEIYALVHDAQAAGRQFVAYSDPTYQKY